MNSNEIFSDLISHTEMEMDYEFFATQMDTVLLEKDPEKFNEKIGGLYDTFVGYAARSGIVRRGLRTWADEFNKQYEGKIYPSSFASEETIINLMNAYFEEKGAEYRCPPRMGRSLEEYIEFMRSTASAVKMHDVQKAFFDRGTQGMFCDAIYDITDRFKKDKGHFVFSSDMERAEDRNVGEVYAVYQKIESIQEEKTFRDVFRHPIDYLRNYFALRAAKSFFKKVGFDIERDGKEAAAKMLELPDHATAREEADIEGLLLGEQIDAKNANIDKTNLKETVNASEKYAKAQAQEAKGGPDSALEKINAIYEKYGVKCKLGDDGMPDKVHNVTYAERELAKIFDQSRDVEDVKHYMRMVYYMNLTNMVGAACDKAKENGGKIDIHGIMKDASDAAFIMYDKFTILYDTKETKELAKNSTFGTYNADEINNHVVKIITAKGQMDRYNASEIKSEIENTVSEYMPVIKEESKEIKNEENVIDDNVDSKENEGVVNDNRMSIKLDIGDQENINGEIVPKIEEKEISIEGTVKQ